MTELVKNEYFKGKSCNCSYQTKHIVKLLRNKSFRKSTKNCRLCNFINCLKRLQERKLMKSDEVGNPIQTLFVFSHRPFLSIIFGLCFWPLFLAFLMRPVPYRQTVFSSKLWEKRPDELVSGSSPETINIYSFQFEEQDSICFVWL